MADDKIRDISEEFLGADLGDPRRAQRLLKLAQSMAAVPGDSFPKAMSPAETEAAYQFLGNSAVESEAIVEPHVRQTVGRVAGEDVTLVAHDSSIISFNTDGSREGLSPARGSKQHFLAHCSLAVKADGSHCPLGVLAVSYHQPVGAVDGALHERWGEHVKNVHALGVEANDVVHLMDREADDYGLLKLLTSIGARFVLRVQHNRRLKAGKLHEVLRVAEPQTEREIEIAHRHGKAGHKQHKTHPRREARTVRLAISSTNVLIHRRLRSRTLSSDTLSLNVVRAWEPDPPPGQAAVEWFLYTTEPVDTPEQVLQVVDWYRARWVIEEYFKALKTGCAIERRQLRDFHSLTNAMSLFVPIAWKILQLRNAARLQPDKLSTDLLSQDELSVLRVAAHTKLPPNPTINVALLAIAGLGGHRKHNGRPGWLTLARGYLKLSTLVEGWQLRRSVETALGTGECDHL